MMKKSETLKLYEYILEHCPHGLVNKLQEEVKELHREFSFNLLDDSGLVSRFMSMDAEDWWYCYLCALEVHHENMIQFIKDSMPYSSWPRLVWDEV